MSFKFSTKQMAKKVSSNKRMTSPGARLGPKFLTINKYAGTGFTKRVKLKDGSIVNRPILKKGQQVVTGFDENTNQIALLLDGFTDEMSPVKLQESDTNKGAFFFSARGGVFKNNPKLQLAENQTHRMYDAEYKDGMILLTPRSGQEVGSGNSNGKDVNGNTASVDDVEEEIDEDDLAASTGEDVEAEPEVETETEPEKPKEETPKPAPKKPAKKAA